MVHQPLADRMRPQNFTEMVGQPHLFGKNGILTKMGKQQYQPNLILFGASGTGKTTTARLLAKQSGMELYALNATSASLADVKEILTQTKTLFGSNGILLYLDEIQYFNKKQQQSLLEYMEDGRITLIASTTENPYFVLYNALLSRSTLLEFKAITAEDMIPVLERGFLLLNEEQHTTKIAERDGLERIASYGAGDVRRSINLLETVYFAAEERVTAELVQEFMPKILGNFDRAGDVHYDLVSALQKSIRGSDPDASIFYLARLLEGGELLAACRRLQVIASEDIGLAYPMAASIVRACVESAVDLGMPEAHIPLANATLLLATAPKSNSANCAYENALTAIQSGKGQQPPLALRSPLFQNYRYPHDYPHHHINDQQYLPDDLKGEKYYQYGENRTEQAAKLYWEKIKNGSL